MYCYDENKGMYTIAAIMHQYIYKYVTHIVNKTLSMKNKFFVLENNN